MLALSSINSSSTSAPASSAMEALPEWGTANQSYGVGYHDHERRSAAATQPVAGLSAFEAAYAAAANDFPRFERQMIKSIFDKAFVGFSMVLHQFSWVSEPFSINLYGFCLLTWDVAGLLRSRTQP